MNKSRIIILIALFFITLVCCRIFAAKPKYSLGEDIVLTNLGTSTSQSTAHNATKNLSQIDKNTKSVEKSVSRNNKKTGEKYVSELNREEDVAINEGKSIEESSNEINDIVKNETEDLSEFLQKDIVTEPYGETKIDDIENEESYSDIPVVNNQNIMQDSGDSIAIPETSISRTDTNSIDSSDNSYPSVPESNKTGTQNDQITVDPDGASDDGNVPDNSDVVPDDNDINPDNDEVIPDENEPQDDDVIPTPEEDEGDEEQFLTLDAILNMKDSEEDMLGEQDYSREKVEDVGTALPTSLLDNDEVVSAVEDLIIKVSFESAVRIINGIRNSEPLKVIMEDIGFVDVPISSIRRVTDVSDGVLFNVTFSEEVDLRDYPEFANDTVWYEPNCFVESLALEADQIYNDVMSMVAKDYFFKRLGMGEMFVEEDIENPREIIIAVLDTGIDPSLSSSEYLWENKDEIPNNGIDDDKNGYIDDCSGWNFVDNNNEVYDIDGHGSRVAWVIERIVKSSGLNLNIKIMPVKIMTAEGGDTEDIFHGFRYAVNMGAKVINGSWGSSDYSSIIAEAVKNAHENGCVVIAASGNSGFDRALFPASDPHVISVGAYNITTNISYFSNKPEICAPGQGMLCEEEDTIISGTSFASPCVAAISAILLTYESLSPEELRYNLRAQANVVRPMPFKDQMEADAIEYTSPMGYYFGNLNAFLIYRPEYIERNRVCRILSPNTNVVSGVVSIKAVAKGAECYRLSYSNGVNPSDGNWTDIAIVSEEIQKSDLFCWDTTGLDDGMYTIRINGIFKDGNSRGIDSDTRVVYVNNDQNLPDNGVIQRPTLLSSSLCIEGNGWNTFIYLSNPSERSCEAYLRFYSSGNNIPIQKSVMLHPFQEKKIFVSDYFDEIIGGLDIEIMEYNSKVTGKVNVVSDKQDTRILNIPLNVIKALSVKFLCSFQSITDIRYKTYIAVLNRSCESVSATPVFFVNGKETVASESIVVTGYNTCLVEIGKYLPGSLQEYKGNIGLDFNGDSRDIGASVIVYDTFTNEYLSSPFIGTFQEEGNIFKKANWNPSPLSQNEKNSLLKALEQFSSIDIPERTSLVSNLLLCNPTDSDIFVNIDFTADTNIPDVRYKRGSIAFMEYSGIGVNYYEPGSRVITHILKSWDNNYAGIAEVLTSTLTSIAGGEVIANENICRGNDYLEENILTEDAFTRFENSLFPYTHYSLLTVLDSFPVENGLYSVNRVSFSIQGPIRIPAHSVKSLPTESFLDKDMGLVFDYICANRCRIYNESNGNSLICSIVVKDGNKVVEVIPLKNISTE